MGAECQSAEQMERQATTTARENARTLRTAMTDAERRLWSRLRGEQLGVKFRRQHPVGPYVLDFACLNPKLAIEVDGSQHLEQASYDARRDAWLAAQGFRVLRFWANAVMSDVGTVAGCILDACRAAAPIPAFPQKGKEKGELRSQIESHPAPTPTLPQRGREFSEDTP